MTDAIPRTAALIAVRRGALAKSRLASALDQPSREQLVRELLARVVAAARAARGVDQVFIVSPQRDGLPEGCSVLVDDGNGHSEAVTRAVRDLTAHGIEELLILPGDLARVEAADLEALLAAGRSAGAAIAPDHHGTGTNAFYLRLPTSLTFTFGPQSCVRHRSALRASGIEPAVLARPGLAYDVDEPQDLERVRDTEPRRRAHA